MLRVSLSKLFILLLVSSVAVPDHAGAHEISPSVSDVTVTGDEISVLVELSLETLLAGIDASQYSDTNDAPQSEEYDRLRAMTPTELEAALKSGWTQASESFQVESAAPGSVWQLQDWKIPPVEDVELVRFSTIRFQRDLVGSEPVAFGATPEFGPFVVRHVGAGEDAFQGYLRSGELTPPLPRTGGAAESAGQTFLRYIVLGVEHIIPKGLDHILFVLGLFFFSLKFRPLLWQVTTFTAAHTTTLALATLGIVTVPAAIVEPLIAASIVYIAVENLSGRDSLTRARIGVVFAFGLLHGLGFASVLGDIGLGQGQFVVGLIGFNIGVEIGQLLVIAAAFGAVGLWFGKRDFYRPWIANPASIAIGLTGAYWVVERTLF